MKTLSFFAVILFSIFSFNTSNAQTVKKETIKVWGNCGMCKTKIEKAARSAGAATANWNEDSKELKVSYAVNKTSNKKIQQAIVKTGYDTQDLTADNKAYEKLPGCCQYDRKDAAEIAVDKNSSSHTGCKHDDKAAGCSKDMAAGTAKSCCSKAGTTTEDKKCSANAGCKHDGKDMACSKDKSCCSKSAGMATGKKCCDNTSCKHDGKMDSCKDMACCKEKSCCSKMESGN